MVTIAVSMGDPAGCGPELIADVCSRGLPRCARLVVFGDERLLKRCGFKPHRRVELVQAGKLAGNLRRGRFSLAAARSTLECLRLAASAVRSGRADALVTGPIHKRTLSELGQRGPGQTEWLARFFGAELPVMAFWSPSFSVVLATTHLPLRRVAAALDRERLERTVVLATRELEGRVVPRRPKLALAALNPHGETGGRPGREEEELLAPAVRRLRSMGIDIRGPLPADSVFAAAREGRFDIVVSMYHDQGLAPLKSLHFYEAVHMTLGLGRVRTSPDHGVAYDIVRRGRRPDPRSMRNAIRLAAELAGGCRP
ncbi:MAG: 4-hydroxythreonine-4-phosphate dehydrogenase PdxA [Deltaproteobacteria bacterium]|nr:MAG: 4-hydroxythreonine-4-phosphate dehydrogenase PdxA [Deltaproteobacteria bacterium]